MKKLKITLLATLISSSLFFIGCSKDDEGTDTTNGNNTLANCFDGIKNQNETDIDCGGICPPCDSAATDPISFTIDGNAVVISDFDANRNPLNNPPLIALIALTDNSGRLSIIINEPTVTGWSDGLSFLSLTPPNVINYDLDVNGTTVYYSSSYGNNKEELSFLNLDYKVGGHLSGGFSGVLEDIDGNKISIENGKFNTTFVN